MRQQHCSTTGAQDTLRELFTCQQSASVACRSLSYAKRIEALDALANGIFRHEDRLVTALHADFGHRSAHETRLLELFPLIDEIRHIRRHLRGWMRPRAVAANWQFWPSRARLLYQPLGVVGVIGAWNYPILLTLSPLVNALAAGNHVMIKPSELAPATAEVIRHMIAEIFTEEYVNVVTGGADVSAGFARLPFDHLFFTGSSRVGRLIMQAAAQNLTPVTLELGGKSPALIHASYSLDVAADRICSAKLLNGGQTCVAPDYVMVPAQQAGAFIQAATEAIGRRLARGLGGGDYTHMISAAAWQRMHELLEDARSRGAQILQINPAGEPATAENRIFPPTLVLGANETMRLMQEEIFGPILPVITYDSLDEAIARINAQPRPLALYYFDSDRQRIDHVLQHTVSGGVTINDCIFHLAQHRLPFGGIGQSGMGAYHGFDGFETFSKKKAVLLQHPLTGALIARLAKPPYGAWTERLTGFLLARKKHTPVRRVSLQRQD